MTGRVGLVVVVVAVLATQSAHAHHADDAARAAVDWLATQSATGLPADQAAERLASLSIGAVASTELLDIVRADGPPRAAEQPAYAARIVMGLHALGLDPRAFDGVDYVAILQDGIDPVTGRLDDTSLYGNAVAGLGLVAGGVEPPASVMRYLRANECPGGGFGHRSGCLGGADTDTTAMTLSLLAALDPSDPMVGRGIAWLDAARTAEGGWGVDADAPTNANSTGLVLSALAAVGGQGHAAGVRALRGLQTADGGVRFLASQRSANAYATVQAIPGLAARAYPIGPTPAGDAPIATPTAPQTRADGAEAPPEDAPPVADPTDGPRPARGSDQRSMPGARAVSDDGTSGSSRAVPIAIAASLLGLSGVAVGARRVRR